MSSLRRNLLWPTLLLAGLVGAALVWAAWDATVTMQRLELEVAEVRNANALALRLTQIVGERQKLVVAHRYIGSEEQAHDIEAMAVDIGAVMSRIDPGSLTPRGERIWTQFVATEAAQERNLTTLLAAVRSQDPVRVGHAFDRWAVSGRNAAALLADFTGHSLRRLDAAVAELELRRNRSMLFLLTLLAAGVLAVVGFRVYLGRRIVRPLVAMAGTATRIAREREAIPVEGDSRDDEIGTLARAINQMTGDLVRANTQLGEALKIRDEFLSIASHELKTPLTSLRLQLEILQRRMAAKGVEPPPQILSAARQEQRLEALIAELLDVTRIRAGRFALRRGEVDLSKLVVGVLERFEPELERGAIEVSADLEDGLVGEWDAERLDQVVTNLVSNVTKYAPGAPLRVRTFAQDGVAILDLRDSGPGIALSVKQRLFEPYQRASNHESTGGLGLGLYITKEIVQAHGGEIRVESEDGRGTAFVVTLPRARPAAT